MPKAPSTQRRGQQPARRPLGQDVQEDRMISRFGRVRAPGKRAPKKSADDDEAERGQDADGQLKVTGGRASQSFVDPRLSRKILKLAREQQNDMEREEAELEAADELQDDEAPQRPAAYRSAQADAQMESDEEDEDEEDRIGEEAYDEPDYAELDISPEDRALLESHDAEEEAAYAGGEAGEEAGGAGARPPRGTLADMIMAKIEAAECGGLSGAAAAEDEERLMPPGINPKVIEVYERVGELLSRYKSGPLPKAFKIIPSLPAWEDIVYITNPEMWTPHATLAATRIFVSNLKPAQCERFYQLVLLDKIRDEIRENKKVSYQMYEAIKKSIYKPAAFFKGILFPLCDGGGVTLKEAAIIGSVIAKVSIPVLHSAAALLRLAEMEYTGPTSLFIRILLDKKYALPYKTIDALVYHFLQFADKSRGVEVTRTRAGVVGERRMPVLWHQSLLVFAQRYKSDLTPDQKSALLDLIRVQRHAGIEPEIRRELSTGESRGEMLPEPLEEDDDMSI